MRKAAHLKQDTFVMLLAIIFWTGCASGRENPPVERGIRSTNRIVHPLTSVEPELDAPNSTNPTADCTRHLASLLTLSSNLVLLQTNLQAIVPQSEIVAALHEKTQHLHLEAQAALAKVKSLQNSNNVLATENSHRRESIRSYESDRASFQGLLELESNIIHKVQAFNGQLETIGISIHSFNVDYGNPSIMFTRGTLSVTWPLGSEEHLRRFYQALDLITEVTTNLVAHGFSISSFECSSTKSVALVNGHLSLRLPN